MTNANSLCDGWRKRYALIDEKSKFIRYKNEVGNELKREVLNLFYENYRFKQLLSFKFKIKRKLCNFNKDEISNKVQAKVGEIYSFFLSYKAEKDIEGIRSLYFVFSFPYSFQWNVKSLEGKLFW